jgi:phosphoribosyl 1,2-cyclic phosphodiesterase
MQTRTSQLPGLFHMDADAHAAERNAPVPAGPTRPARGPCLELCVLGSGSGGNSSVIRVAGRCILIDAGFGPRTIFKRLEMAGVDPDGLHDVLVTHLDRDHLRPNLLPILLERRIRLHLHRWHLPDLQRLEAAERLASEGLVHCFDFEPFELPEGDVRVRPVALPHDLKGTVGFRIETSVGSVGYATDLGQVPEALIEAMTGADLVAIESNYDPGLQRSSGRPVFLQRRIMGMAGHLSNEQSFATVQKVLDRSPPGLPQHVVLLHVSRQCNHVGIIRQVFEADARLKGRLTLSGQRRRSRWLKVQPLKPLGRRQMPLMFR